LKERSKREQLLVPKVVYGYFPCQSAGNDLIVYDEKQQEQVRFTFPRQPAGKHFVPGGFLCVAGVGAHGCGRVSSCDGRAARE
jgi:5-methyltetrahydrofolate--homocysteine methyltransferase